MERRAGGVTEELHSDRAGDHEREELRNSKQHIDNEMSGYTGQGSRKDVYFLLRLN